MDLISSPSIRLARSVALVCLSLISAFGFADSLNVPPRPAGALTGSQVVAAITSMNLTDRENRIYQEVTSGNIPDFMRTLVPITVSAQINGQTRTAVYHVLPDYLALGSNDNYFLCPMTPLLAQRLCDTLGCILPTRKMVNDIWAAAPVHLAPQPIPPSPEMTTVPVFDQHNTMVWTSRSALLDSHPLGALVGGDKKDVVITIRLATEPGKVAIYGWHYQNGTPIQNLYLGHGDTYADYSHGIRLVNQAMTVDGNPTTVDAVLRDATLHPLLSDEGALTQTRYNIPGPTPVPTPTPEVSPTPQPTPTPIDDNLVKNGSFEDGFSGGIGNHWSPWKSASSDSISYVAASINKHDGANSQYWARSTANPFQGGVYQVIDVQSGYQYHVTAWMMKQQTQTGTEMAFGYDLTGGTDGTSPFVIYQDMGAPTDNTWVQFSETIISSGSQITIFAKGAQSQTNDGAKSFFYLDQVRMVSLGPAPTPIAASHGLMLTSQNK